MGDVWATVDAHAAAGRMADNVRRTRGVAGARWLDSVPDTARALAAQWQFTPDRVHPDSYRSLVLQGHLVDGSPAALKIEPVATAQTAALLAFAAAGHGPPVHAAAAHANACLLGWVPGRPLTPTAGDMAAATTAALAVDAHTNAQAAPRLAGVPTFTEWMQVAITQARSRLSAADRLGSYFDDALLDADLRLAHQQPESPHGLRHGDLVPPNALLRPDGTVAFIDPDPYYGPAEADIAWLAQKMNAAQDVDGFLFAAHAAHPALDHDLLGWLASHAARTYVAYKVAMGHDIPPGYLTLAAVPAYDW